MTLADAVDVIEMIGGILLGLGGIAFILLGLLAEIRPQSAAKQKDLVGHSRDPIVRLMARTKKSSFSDAERKAA